MAARLDLRLLKLRKSVVPLLDFLGKTGYVGRRGMG